MSQNNSRLSFIRFVCVQLCNNEPFPMSDVMHRGIYKLFGTNNYHDKTMCREQKP